MPALQLIFLIFWASLTAALGPWQHFHTEPTFRTCIFNVSVNTHPNLLAPGYLWITPYVSDFRAGSFGPQIYTMNGELVWNGNDSAQVRAMDAHVCDYMGERGNHICMHDAAPVEQGGHSAGVVRFLDNTYSPVGLGDYEEAGSLRKPDIHELNTPHLENGHSFLQDVYQVKEMDLTPFFGPREGFVLDCCFQRINLATRAVLFQWCALDHIDVWDTYLYLHDVGSPNKSLPIAGNGSRESPWDFMHLNSIDETTEADFIVSARHLDTIFKIAGNDSSSGLAPGSIIWRLNGKRSDFELDSFDFSRQHTVRCHFTGTSKTLISLFNNNYDGWNHRGSQSYSDGQLIEVNNSTMIARRLRSYPNPDRTLCYSQGGMQFLPNGNVLMGWGSQAHVSEHTHGGEAIYSAYFSGNVESYRAWKFPWIGRPVTPPKVLGYAYDADHALYAYISWNGATEVASYNVYTSTYTAHGPWRLEARIPRSGFETFVNFTEIAMAKSRFFRADIVRFRPYISVEALDATGAILGTSATSETFIPNEMARNSSKCNESLCNEKWFTYPAELSAASTVPRSLAAAIWLALFLLSTTELVQWALMAIIW